MILSNELVVHLLKEVKEKGRSIDYYLLRHLFEPQNARVMKALKAYRNPDGGFGHGLEADVRLPASSVVATDEAVAILDVMPDDPVKEEWIKGIVSFYESQYIPDKHGWELVPPEVDQYPRAVWWNYSGVNDFSYGNPTPQVAGFLYTHKSYLKELDLDALIEYVTDYILNVFPHESRKHNILSCLHFYVAVDPSIQAKIRPVLQTAIDKELGDNWEEYGLQPYEILLIDRSFLEGHEELLALNLDYCLQKLEQGLIMPNWQWYQYEDVFEKARWEWAGHLTYRVIQALLI